MSRIAFVVNPRSDGGRTGDGWPRIEKRVRHALGPIAVHFTQARGDGTRLAREALGGGAELVVAVGGDGTLGEVANGFFDEAGRGHPTAVFAFYQRGTGGDFQRTFAQAQSRDRGGPPRDPSGPGLSALDATLDGLTAYVEQRSGAVAIDVGRLDYTTHEGRAARRHFLNIASFGIGGAFDAMLNRSHKMLGGRIATRLTGARALATYEHQRVRLQLDDTPSRTLRIHNVAVANGAYYGGGQHIAPDARIDDGLFDVAVLGDLTVTDKLAFAARIFDGAHTELRRVEVLRARRVFAEPAPAPRGSDGHAEGPVLLDVDGEQPGRLPATFEVVPRALRVCLPADVAHGAFVRSTRETA